MQVIEGIDELGEADLLARLEVLHATERRVQAEVLALAAQFAVLHDEHTRVGLTPWSARTLIGDALDLKHRLPQLWARVQALEVKAS